MAEMGADLWAAQAADVYSADWSQQEDADARFPVRPTLFLTPPLPLSTTLSSLPSSQPTPKPTKRSTYISSHAHTLPL